MRWVYSEGSWSRKKDLYPLLLDKFESLERTKTVTIMHPLTGDATNIPLDIPTDLLRTLSVRFDEVFQKYFEIKYNELYSFRELCGDKHTRAHLKSKGGFLTQETKYFKYTYTVYKMNKQHIEYKNIRGRRRNLELSDPTDVINYNKLLRTVAPNWVQSWDASINIMVILKLKEKGIKVFSTHDC